MSLVTQLAEKKITPAQFVTQASQDLKTDLAFFEQIPGYTSLVTWAVDALGALVEAKCSFLSPTMISLIESQIIATIAPASTPAATS
jgi:hypothetical protein